MVKQCLENADGELKLTSDLKSMFGQSEESFKICQNAIR